MDEREWFFAEGPSQMGPVTRAELGAALSRLPPGTLVWRSGLPNWMPAESLPELADLLRRPVMPPPPPPPPPPVPSYTPPAPGGYAPPAPVAQQAPYGQRGPSGYRPYAPPASPEDTTLNPFVLWRRPWGGRFTRAQFAIAYFGAAFLSFVVAIVAGVVTAAAGEKSPVALVATIGFALITLLNVALCIGAVVRRLHDLGQSGFLVLVMLLPCINLLFLIYLLVAPGQGEQAAGGGSTGTLIVIAVCLAVLAIPAIGIIAAIAIPSLLRARVSANESAAIGDVRTVISGQAAYQSVNRANMYAGRAECLWQPSRCNAGYEGPTFVDASVFQSPKGGYNRELVGGPGGEPHVAEFAFIALPATPGQTGVRSFCGDATGRVCAMQVGMREALVEQTPSGAKCSAICTDLR